MRTLIGWALVLAGAATTVGPLIAETSADGEWHGLGLIRVRDLTPFGIARLDFLPAHSIDAPAGSFAVEVNLAYQNTYVTSPAVVELLAARGRGRASLSAEDAAAIVALPDDAVFVDGELALLDLTLHYAFTNRLSGYATIPTYAFQGGFLDSAIEGFHEEFGFSSAHRDLVERNQFQIVYAIGDQAFVALEPPDDYQLGDPVLGLRWSLGDARDSVRFVLEAAVKPGWSSSQTLVTTGRDDYGVQATVQRRSAHDAVYLSASVVSFGGADLLPGASSSYLGTLIAGYERRVTRYTNAVLQVYVSPSVVQDTTLDELAATKYQLTLGLVSRRNRHAWRFALTENLSNFSNTPDIGISLGYAHIVGADRGRGR